MPDAFVQASALAKLKVPVFEAAAPGQVSGAAAWTATTHPILAAVAKRVAGILWRAFRRREAGGSGRRRTWAVGGVSPLSSFHPGDDADN